MMKYSVEKHVQMLIYLMKQHGVRKVIVSPGMKNIPFVASVQFDPYFEVYSCVDERSAAYMAYGMAMQSGEPVALSCTGATASRNYYSALTEAFYNNVPILAITSMSHTGEIGHLKPQIIDRSVQPNDTIRFSTEIRPVNNSLDEWDVNVKINTALLELRHKNGGPVHINLISENYTDFTDSLIKTRAICRYTYEDDLPEITASQVAIFIGEHTYFDTQGTSLIDLFCQKYNGVVICDKTSNYYGKYLVFPSALNSQVSGSSSIFNVDLLIHIGNVSGSYIGINAKHVWRVNIDGEVRDTFKKLECVFEMSEKYFFNMYSKKKQENGDNSYYAKWKGELKKADPYEIDIPFSNAWIAGRIENRIHEGSVLFLGILNTLRNWNFYDITNGVECHSNTGGFGIDGILSTAIGSALARKDKTHYVVLGDLGFFYDMNSLGNRHFPNNLRVILVNNGRGIEFRNYHHPSAKFGEDADKYMAAAGHFGNQSDELVKHYATDLGFEYISANTKDDFLLIEEKILADEQRNQPLFVEVFTKTEDESRALELICNIYHDQSPKQIAKNILGENGVKAVKKLLNR